MFSYFEPNFIEKFLRESVFFFFKFWPKSKWREMKIGYLAAILNGKTFQKKKKNSQNYDLYGANFIAKFRWENGFGGSMDPLGLQREWK